MDETIENKEDFDTFEHRVIKTYLKKLRNLIKVRQKMEVMALENEKSRLELSIDLEESELEERINELNQEIERKKEERKELLK